MSDPFIGEITIFAGNFAPRGWAFCDGQLLQINQNTALFSLLGTTYGGDGRTTFGLPELRGRSPLHWGNGPGLSTFRLGQRGGAESHTLTRGQLPPHSHTVAPACNTNGGTSNDPEDNVPNASGGSLIYGPPGTNEFMAPTTSSSTGGNQSFSIRSPYQAVNFIIALTGLFPSRN